MGDLKITQSDVDGVSHAKRVELEGAIDATSIADLTGLVDVLFGGATRWFLVDMRGIKYVNSTGLGSLVKYADQFTSRGGGMILYGLPPKVKVIIKMLGLDSFFPIVNTIDDALAEVARAGGLAKGPQKEAEEPTKVSPPSVPVASAPVAPSPSPAATNANIGVSSALLVEILEESKRTNRLLKAVVLELRQLRAEFDEEGS